MTGFSERFATRTFIVVDGAFPDLPAARDVSQFVNRIVVEDR